MSGAHTHRDGSVAGNNQCTCVIHGICLDGWLQIGVLICFHQYGWLLCAKWCKSLLRFILHSRCSILNCLPELVYPHQARDAYTRCQMVVILPPLAGLLRGGHDTWEPQYAPWDQYLWKINYQVLTDYTEILSTWCWTLINIRDCNFFEFPNTLCARIHVCIEVFISNNNTY